MLFPSLQDFLPAAEKFVKLYFCPTSSHYSDTIPSVVLSAQVITSDDDTTGSLDTESVLLEYPIEITFSIDLNVSGNEFHCSFIFFLTTKD